MTLINVGPEVTQQAISSAITQMVGTIDLLKQREQALSAILAQATDADLIALGFTQVDVNFLRGGMQALDALVTQGLANATVKEFTDRARNYGQ